VFPLGHVPDQANTSRRLPAGVSLTADDVAATIGEHDTGGQA
jgi:hypothetical protein